MLIYIKFLYFGAGTAALPLKRGNQIGTSVGRASYHHTFLLTLRSPFSSVRLPFVVFVECHLGPSSLALVPHDPATQGQPSRT
jgi:hypothetical protein